MFLWSSKCAISPIGGYAMWRFAGNMKGRAREVQRSRSDANHMLDWPQEISRYISELTGFISTQKEAQIKTHVVCGVRALSR